MAPHTDLHDLAASWSGGGGDGGGATWCLLPLSLPFPATSSSGIHKRAITCSILMASSY